MEFFSRSTFFQDVAFGTKTLKLSSGERIPIPSVVRTMTESKIIYLYHEECREHCVEPLKEHTCFCLQRFVVRLSKSPCRGWTVRLQLVKKHMRRQPQSLRMQVDRVLVQHRPKTPFSHYGLEGIISKVYTRVLQDWKSLVLITLLCLHYWIQSKRNFQVNVATITTRHVPNARVLLMS